MCDSGGCCGVVSVTSSRGQEVVEVVEVFVPSDEWYYRKTNTKWHLMCTSADSFNLATPGGKLHTIHIWGRYYIKYFLGVSFHRLVCEVEDVAVEEGGLALLHRHARLRVPEVGVRGELIWNNNSGVMRSFGAGSSEKIWRLIVNGTIRKVANDNCAAQWAVIINILLRPARGRADSHNKDLTIQIQIMSEVRGSTRHPCCYAWSRSSVPMPQVWPDHTATKMCGT